MVGVHAARPLEHGLDDDGGELVAVCAREGSRTACAHASNAGPSVSQRSSSVSVTTRRAAGGRGAKTCRARAPGKAECIPSTGSQTLIAANVSPW